jgi:hypothetical protein
VYWTEMAKNLVKQKWQCQASRLYYYQLQNYEITQSPVGAQANKHANIKQEFK